MPDLSSASLSTDALTVRVPGRLLVADLTLELVAGELLAVLGQNGSGKSLSMTTLCGLRQADGGRVLWGGEDIHVLARAALARHVALLPQVSDDVFPSTVRETALIGRYPHIGRFSWESPEDVAIADAALERVGLDALAERDILTLSGGERRRLAIAQILAQSPDVYLLDEPTNHLDPQHQIDAMRIFRQLADAGASVVASLHDVNLATRFADRCLLLFGDGRWQLGSRDDVLDERLLSELYGTPMRRIEYDDGYLFMAAG